MAATAVGPLVRDWRTRRRRSQMDLALDVGVSPRHLSFVETGRSKPSPELLLAVADRLDVPLRERNTLLLAAGYAPRYTQRTIETMGPVRNALQRLLDTHEPYPGVVIDRAWNVVLANEAGLMLAGLLPEELRGPPTNVFRACLHPAGLATRTLNFPEWSAYLLNELRRAAVLSGDPALESLANEVAGYPNIASLEGWRARLPTGEPPLLVPLRIHMFGIELSLFTTLTMFGTPQDVTLAELAVELFFPADELTASTLRDLSTAREPQELLVD
ncbi:MAG: helix-turn-helix transcriptional regulator [Acidimicrobiales bacterium]